MFSQDRAPLAALPPVPASLTTSVNEAVKALGLREQESNDHATKDVLEAPVLSWSFQHIRLRLLTGSSTLFGTESLPSRHSES